MRSELKGVWGEDCWSQLHSSLVCEVWHESLRPVRGLSQALHQWHVRPTGASGRAPGQQPAGSADHVQALSRSRWSCGSSRPYPMHIGSTPSSQRVDFPRPVSLLRLAERAPSRTRASACARQNMRLCCLRPRALRVRGGLSVRQRPGW